ncbi:hypothetical protein J3Q64DRAFT_1748372 [Phycomyces blakesleeanus]|uniref:Uncharacterized protein n=1 Tax=Phycomyces blakesleeanus TaxID=4837 RepID=A0ABR3AWH6_PHYBL
MFIFIFDFVFVLCGLMATWKISKETSNYNIHWISYLLFVTRLEILYIFFYLSLSLCILTKLAWTD